MFGYDGLFDSVFDVVFFVVGCWGNSWGLGLEVFGIGIVEYE